MTEYVIGFALIVVPVALALVRRRRAQRYVRSHVSRLALERLNRRLGGWA
jgi:hypothetical protein